jgi:hypothetical protein
MDTDTIGLIVFAVALVIFLWPPRCHGAMPACDSFEMRFPDDRPS